MLYIAIPSIALFLLVYNLIGILKEELNDYKQIKK